MSDKKSVLLIRIGLILNAIYILIVVANSYFKLGLPTALKIVMTVIALIGLAVAYTENQKVRFIKPEGFNVIKMLAVLFVFDVIEFFGGYII